jgi:hypothetical protein
MKCKLLQNFVIYLCWTFCFIATSSFLFISTIWLLRMLKNLLIIEYMMASTLYEVLGLQDASGYNSLALVIYGCRRFMSVYKRHSWDTWIQPTLTLYEFHLYLGLEYSLFPSGFLTKSVYVFLICPMHATHIAYRISHPPQFDHTRNTMFQNNGATSSVILSFTCNINIIKLQ